MKNLIFVLLFLGTCSCGSAQKLDTQAADSLFAFYHQHELYSVNALAKREGTLLYQGSAGYQNREAGIKNNPKTQFLIGSITKTYTAVLIMQLVEEGKLKLDDKLARFYPALPNADRITVEMLLRHRSGLFNYTNAPTFLKDVITPVSKGQFLERFKTLNIDFEPDAKYEYSNTNYLLLGFIVEELTGDRFENQLRKRILEKLNLKDTYYGRPDDRTHFAKSYIFNGEKWLPTQPEWNTDWAAAAGGIATTASDLALFFEGLFNGKLVSAQSLARMIDLKDGYGLGISSVPYGNRTFYGHGGGIESYNSFAGYNPTDKTVFVRLVSGQKQQDPNDVSIQILNIAYGRPLAFPSLKVRAAVQVAAEVLRTYEGTYAAPGFPLEIKVFEQEGKLYGQATGQSAFLLTPYSNTEFGFDMAKIEMDFFQKDGQQAFHFLQGPNKLDFVRKP